jgi:eukaryotic-like serine/threonine-protein kinase
MRRPGHPGRPGGVEDRYRSLFVIGRGGMGTVEVALEQGAEGFERVVALKRLLPEGARDSRHKEMFLREARLAALLAHPNVVHAFAFGEIYGELFIAMEYVEGEPLSDVLRTARDRDCGLAPGLVAFVLAEVCDGLHAAHELRDKEGQPLHVVHRDVSPHNVMIAYDGQVKLLDFGVAKFEAGGNETRTGEVKGKMAYMSPEQALGEKLDRRSDLFSIGAVLFECVTGRRMWGSGTDLEVMRRLALETPPRLDDTIAPPPRALVDLHARLVARDPEARPATAQDVANELRAFAFASVPAPDTETVRSLMRVLFERQARGRQDQLTDSLRQAAPARAEELRRGLDAQLPLDPPSSVEPVIVQSPPSGRSLRERPRRGRVAAVLVLLGLGALVATSAALWHGSRAQVPLPVPVAHASASVPPVPPATARATADVVAVAPAPPSPIPTQPRVAATRPSATPVLAGPSPPPAPAPLRLHPSAQPPSPAPAKLPDVDPTPF